MKYSYKKCKKFLEDLGYKFDKYDYILIDVHRCGNDELNDSLQVIVRALNNEFNQPLDDDRCDVIYTLLKNNKDKLIEEE